MTSDLITIFAFEIILLSLFYSLQLKAFRKFSNNAAIEKDPKTPGISVVIAVKNEESNILTTVNSIQLNHYPATSYEILIINDYSSDSTPAILRKLAGTQSNLAVLDNVMSPGKRNALSTGIEAARYDYIVITDGDCLPEKKWLESYAMKFSEGFDFIIGVAPFLEPSIFIEKIAAYENFKTGLLTLTTLSLDKPHTAAARNLGFSKTAFNICGGYENTKETLSGDDDLLLREFQKKKMKIGFLGFGENRVFSKAKSNFREYLDQKARHTSTSFHYLSRHKVFLAIWHTPQIFFSLSFLLAFMSPWLFLLTLIKTIYDYLLISRLSDKYSYKFSFFEKISLPFIYEFLLVVNILRSLRSPVKWK
ncbi:MAG: glycosyltransferase [Ignavibacteriaceae bacterium]|nr:glycosyltransferase [Ignavibacteriaceae bacterium]